MADLATTAVSILFDGLAYGMILFIISVGLSVTMGLMNFVIPEMIAMQSTVQDERHEHKDVFAHTMRVLANTPRMPEIRWAALMHDVGKPRTKSIRNRRIRFFGHEEVGARMARRIGPGRP